MIEIQFTRNQLSTLLIVSEMVSLLSESIDNDETDMQQLHNDNVRKQCTFTTRSPSPSFQKRLKLKHFAKCLARVSNAEFSQISSVTKRFLNDCMGQHSNSGIPMLYLSIKLQPAYTVCQSVPFCLQFSISVVNEICLEVNSLTSK